MLSPTPVPTTAAPSIVPPTLAPSARGYNPDSYCPQGHYKTPETFYNGVQKCLPCSVGGWFCPPGSVTPFGQLYMNETESVCPAGFGCYPGSQAENASRAQCAAGFYCPPGSVDRQGKVGMLGACSSTVTLIGETSVSVETRTYSGGVPESIKGHCAVNLTSTLVILNSSDGYLCARDGSQTSPVLELDGRIVLAGASTCTVAEQAKLAEQAGAAALLISPLRISRDIPGARPIDCSRPRCCGVLKHARLQLTMHSRAHPCYIDVLAF
jgi:hypothetical protein